MEEQHKPGWQSTAFWMAVLAKFVSIATVVVGMLDPNPITKCIEIVIGALAAVLTALGYMKSNKDLKVARTHEVTYMAPIPPVAVE